MPEWFDMLPNENALLLSFILVHLRNSIDSQSKMHPKSWCALHCTKVYQLLSSRLVSFLIKFDKMHYYWSGLERQRARRSGERSANKVARVESSRDERRRTERTRHVRCLKWWRLCDAIAARRELERVSEWVSEKGTRSDACPVWYPLPNSFTCTITLKRVQMHTYNHTP